MQKRENNMYEFNLNGIEAICWTWLVYANSLCELIIILEMNKMIWKNRSSSICVIFFFIFSKDYYEKV